MAECYKCGISESKSLLFGAVTPKGILKICRKCSFDEGVPIIKNMKEEFEKRPSVYERLSKMSGIEQKKVFQRDLELERIANENFRKLAFENNPAGMIHNFHWIIMRARRAKKLTQKQLAEVIAEPEEAIQMAEKGILPKHDFSLINKLETYLRIHLTERFEEPSFEAEIERAKTNFFQGVEEDDVKFDEITTKTLTISDLQEMKKKREKGILKKPIEKKLKNKDDLSKEKINRIIFGK